MGRIASQKETLVAHWFANKIAHWRNGFLDNWAAIHTILNTFFKLVEKHIITPSVGIHTIVALNVKPTYARAAHALQSKPVAMMGVHNFMIGGWRFGQDRKP